MENNNFITKVDNFIFPMLSSLQAVIILLWYNKVEPFKDWTLLKLLYPSLLYGIISIISLILFVIVLYIGYVLNKKKGGNK